jgi:isocitrate lyase
VSSAVHKLIHANVIHNMQEPRWKKTKRPYTAEDVVSKRGTLPIAYPAGVLGKKLYAQLSAHWEKREPSHTYGA